MREWREKNPEKARLKWLKDRATKKQIPFDLDLEWLIEFMKVNQYDPEIHHIDRISVLGGYVKGNLQVMLAADNIAKGNRERWGQAYCF